MNLSSTTAPQPEISMDSEGNGIPRSKGIDVRNGSLDDFPDDLINVDIGLSTVPNKYCTVREALELKKLLLLSKGSRGGIAPSTSAVMDMYMVGSVIGVGSYGKVRAAWHRLSGRKVAIKTYDKSRLKDQSHWKRMQSEIKIMETVSHPRIARMYEAVETPKRIHLIMECVEGGNLCSYVKQKKRLHETEAKKIFFQLMLAIEYLHRENVTHRDIKLENVLFTDSRDIKLIDFGFSTINVPGKKAKIFCGTPSYMAPEIVLRTEYEGAPVDMWGAGVLLYACLCGQFPFRAQSYPDLYRRIARGSFALPDEVSSSARDLIRSLLCLDAASRPTASAALKHGWLQTQMVTAPDIGRLRLDTIILISDNPSDDIDNQAVTELVRFGVGKDEVLRQVMTKTHSSIATLYYLSLDALFAVRSLNGQARIQPMAGVSSIINSKRPDSLPSGTHQQPQQPSSALATQFLLRSAGGAGVLNLRPRSASTNRASAQGSRPLSANMTRR
jgi:5'-AMP-activated protein kinase catalytic alpha subunit